MSETARPYSFTPAVDLQITDKIFPKLMETLKDETLSDKEARYLSYLYGVCGTKGVCFRLRETIGADLGKGVRTVSRIERSLEGRGKLIVFEYGGRTYRSPYPHLVQNFLETAQQSTPQSLGEPSDTSCQGEQDNFGTETPRPETAKPAPEASLTAPAPPPYKTIKSERFKTPIQGEPEPTTTNQSLRNEPVDNSSGWFRTKKDSKKNPYNKNKHLVKHMADDICETLGIWQSWKFITKIIWNITEQAEYHLYEVCSWVKEELHCNRVHSPAGLLVWKLREQGVIQ